MFKIPIIPAPIATRDGVTRYGKSVFGARRAGVREPVSCQVSGVFTSAEDDSGC
jgi:hypothetical protein